MDVHVPAYRSHISPFLDVGCSSWVGCDHVCGDVAAASVEALPVMDVERQRLLQGR